MPERDVDLISYLRQKKVRVTASRTAILAALRKNERPLTVNEVQEAIRKQGIIANKVTVYRELAFLQEQQLLTCIQFEDRQKRYEYASAHHHHLVCERCERVEDVRVEEPCQEQTKRLERQTSFKILRHSLEFFGLCQACQS